MSAEQKMKMVWQEYRYYNNDTSAWAVKQRRELVGRAIRIAKEAEKNGK